jgi:Double zinc ribbon
MIFGLFGIENDGLNLVVNLLVFFLFVIYIALVYWVYADATRRLDDPLLIACATVAALFPFIGPIVYSIVRPPEYLEDRHEREIEIKAAERRLAMLDNRTCRNCGAEVEPSFLRCPSCMRKLKEPCRNCAKPLDPRWRVCPYCETEVAGFRDGLTERPRRTRREQERAERMTERADTRDERPRRAERPSAADRQQARLARDGGELPAEAATREPASQPPPRGNR